MLAVNSCHIPGKPALSVTPGQVHSVHKINMIYNYITKKNTVLLSHKQLKRKARMIATGLATGYNANVKKNLCNVSIVNTLINIHIFIIRDILYIHISFPLLGPINNFEIWHENG